MEKKTPSTIEYFLLLAVFTGIIIFMASKKNGFFSRVKGKLVEYRDSQAKKVAGQ